MIDNYFDNVSNNEKKDLACEIILEVGDKEYGNTKDWLLKKRMLAVYKEQVGKSDVFTKKSLIRLQDKLHPPIE